jgi:hypothetical protein
MGYGHGINTLYTAYGCTDYSNINYYFSQRMTKQKELKELAIKFGKTEMMDISSWVEDIPIRFIYKENLNEFDPLEGRTIYGWRFEYKGREYGDYVVISEDSNVEEFLMQVKEILKEQALDVFLYKALLADVLNEDLLGEISYRLNEKYNPVCLEAKSHYATKKKEGGREYHSKFSFKYVWIKLRIWFINKLLKLLAYLLEGWSK